jgi:hypothetical protein
MYPALLFVFCFWDKVLLTLPGLTYNLQSSGSCLLSS